MNKKIAVLGMIVLASILATILYFNSPFEQGPIYTFNLKRDKQDVLRDLKEDLYWLLEDPYGTFDPEFLVKTKSPNKNPRYFGKLHIKVLLDNGKYAGFTTYYKSKFNEGRIQFVSVNKNFRGKGYGNLLTEYAVNELFKMGCTEVKLVTRTNNIWSRRIYQKLGFKEFVNDDGFVDYTIRKK